MPLALRAQNRTNFYKDLQIVEPEWADVHSGSQVDRRIRVSRLTIVLVYTFVLIMTRLADSYYTHAIFAPGDGRVIELNPFANTEGVFGVFLSPVLMMVSALAVALFAWMVCHPDKVLAECARKGSSEKSFWNAEDYVYLPFAMVAMVFFGVLQNASLFYLGEPFVPPLVKSLMPENPTFRLFCYAVIIMIIGRPFFRSGMLGILRYVSSRQLHHLPTEQESRS
jgi:hypothetical protein